MRFSIAAIAAAIIATAIAVPTTVDVEKRAVLEARCNDCYRECGKICEGFQAGPGGGISMGGICKISCQIQCGC